MASKHGAKNVRIAIIGGGLGGLALAIGLQRHNVTTHVYEAAAQFSEIGAGVVFGANAIRALGLIHPALLSGYRKFATRNPPGDWLTYRCGVESRGSASTPRTSTDQEKKVGDILWKQYDLAESGYVRRARLLDEMVKLVPPHTTTFNKRLSRIEEAPDAGVILFFEDGTTSTADAVVGCDGIKSNTRSYVCNKTVEPAYSGQYAYRQLFPFDVAAAVLGPERTSTMTLECGYGGYIVHYPIEGGSFMNMTAVRNDPSSTWEGKTTWLTQVSHDDMLNDWRDWDPRLLRLISHVERPERHALFDLKHDESYTRGLVCLLGDSAHASTPHIGAGAAMAMEDAYVLSALIANVRGPQDLAPAFKAYDATRRPRTQTLINSSRITGLLKSFSSFGVWDDLERMKLQLESTYRWVWDLDLEEQLRESRILMENLLSGKH